MGATLSLAPLEPVVLDPLRKYDSISDTDEYWSVLFHRQLQPGTESAIREVLQSVLASRPQNVGQLVHVGTVQLLDIVHRLSLSAPPDLYEPLRTVIFLLFCAFVLSGSAAEYSRFFHAFFDDCGPIASTLIVSLTKLIHLPGATLCPQMDYWCAGISDVGVQDPLRLGIVELLLALKLAGHQLVEFPGRLFAASVASAMHSYNVGPHSLVRSGLIRLRLIRVSLILMTAARCSPLDARDYPDVFLPLTESLLRVTAGDELDNYIVPLAIQYLLSAPVEAPPAFVHNMLFAADWFRGSEMSKIILLIFARTAQIPGIEGLWQKGADRLALDPPVTAETWGECVIEMAIRTAMKTRKVAAVLAIVVAIMIGKMGDLPVERAREIVRAVKGHRVVEAAIRAVKGRAPGWAEAMRLEAADEEEEEEEEEGSRPFQVEFDFAAHVPELYFVPAVDYFQATKRVSFRHRYVEDDE
jgi:hypothetical protein